MVWVLRGTLNFSWNSLHLYNTKFPSSRSYILSPKTTYGLFFLQELRIHIQLLAFPMLSIELIYRCDYFPTPRLT